MMNWLCSLNKILLVLSLSSHALIGFAQSPENNQLAVVSVAAPSDLKFAFEELIDAFKERHPNIDIKPSYASSGTLYAQLTHKAPFDLFLSADASYPEKLIEQGLAIQGSEFIYAIGRIVIWARNGSGLDVKKQKFDVFKDPTVQKIAIANPRHAPYGRVAKQALEHYQMYDQISRKIVLGENIAQTAQYVESGAADVGMIALSLAIVSPMCEEGTYWEVPQEAYSPLEQQGVILEWAKDKNAAVILKDFLLSDIARAILARHHFNVPKK